MIVCVHVHVGAHACKCTIILYNVCACVYVLYIIIFQRKYRRVTWFIKEVWRPTWMCVHMISQHLHIICERIWARIFRILVLYLRNHSSYELQIWHEYSFIILLHSLQFASPAHFRYGRGERARRSPSKIAVLCPLAAHRSGQEACSDF